MSMVIQLCFKNIMTLHLFYGVLLMNFIVDDVECYKHKRASMKKHFKNSNHKMELNHHALKPIDDTAVDEHKSIDGHHDLSHTKAHKSKLYYQCRLPKHELMELKSTDNNEEEPNTLLTFDEQDPVPNRIEKVNNEIIVETDMDTNEENLGFDQFLSPEEFGLYSFKSIQNADSTPNGSRKLLSHNDEELVSFYKRDSGTFDTLEGDLRSVNPELVEMEHAGNMSVINVKDLNKSEY